MPAPQIQTVIRDRHTPNSLTRRAGPQKVFVYGTLKKGFGNHTHYLGSSKFLSAAAIEGIMFHLGGFPAINLSEKFSRIHGELYEVTWDQILRMDQLEGVGRDFYDRIEARVEPYGIKAGEALPIVWTYVFPRDRAAKEAFVVPSGTWQGPNTARVKWGGFGKGVEIGSFETKSGTDEIKIGAGESAYVLRRSAMDSTYKLVNKESGEVLGSYTHLRDMVVEDGNRKPVLRLPARAVPTTAGTGGMQERVADAIRLDAYKPYAPAPRTTPIVYVPPMSGIPADKDKEEDIPQAARLLGLKYGEA